MRVLTLRMGIRATLPERIYAAIAITMIAAFGVTLGLWALDTRSIDGISVWAKPLKFELALAIYAGTLALVVVRLSPRLRSGPVMRAVALAFLVACTLEMGWIIAQAAQGQHSHFNDSTAFHRAMFSVMAFCAVIITGAAGAVALAVWRDGSFGGGGIRHCCAEIGFARSASNRATCCNLQSFQLARRSGLHGQCR